MGRPRKYSDELRERAVRLSSSRGGRSRTWPRIWGSGRRRCASGCGRPRPTQGLRPELLNDDEREELKRLRKENVRAEAGERDPEGRLAVFRSGARPDPAKMTAYIEARRDTFGVEPVCRVLEVPVSTFYARRSRVPSKAGARRPGAARARSRRRGAATAASTARGRPGRSSSGATSPPARPGARVMRQHGLEGQAPRRQEAHDDRRRDRVERARDLCSATSPPPARTRSGSPT